LEQVNYSAEGIRVLPRINTLMGLLDRAREYPYLFECQSVQELGAFIHGWSIGRDSAGQAPPDGGEFGAFAAWVSNQFPDPVGRSWVAGIASRHLSPDDAWDELFRLLDVWRREQTQKAEPFAAPGPAA
jgi:hypothetical protein